MDDIIAESSIEKMSANSSNPDFFGTGKMTLGGDKVTKELKEEILSLCSDTMENAGYSMKAMFDRI